MRLLKKNIKNILPTPNIWTVVYFFHYLKKYICIFIASPFIDSSIQSGKFVQNSEFRIFSVSQTSGLHYIFQISIYSFAETLKWFEHKWLHYNGSSTTDWTHTRWEVRTRQSYHVTLDLIGGAGAGAVCLGRRLRSVWLDKTSFVNQTAKRKEVDDRFRPWVRERGWGRRRSVCVCARSPPPTQHAHTQSRWQPVMLCPLLLCVPGSMRKSLMACGTLVWVCEQVLTSACLLTHHLKRFRNVPRLSKIFALPGVRMRIGFCLLYLNEWVRNLLRSPIFLQDQRGSLGW